MQKNIGNFYELKKLLFKYRKVYIIFTVLSVLLSIVFSSPLFITPLYKSTLVLFPASTNSVSKVLVSTSTETKEDLLGFGGDERIDQMLQILNSNIISDRIIQKYGLMNHYEINTNSDRKYTILYSKYYDNIQFKRTENRAVKIVVYDSEPTIASDIANDIGALYDTAIFQMQRERSYEGYRIAENEYFKLRDQILKLEDSLAFIRKLGINNPETQSDAYTQQLAVELAKGNRTGVKEIENKLNLIGQYGGAFVSIRDQLVWDKKQLSLLKAKYEEAKVDAFDFLSQKFVVSKAFPAEVKSYPIRWIIVVVTLFSVLVFITTVILIIEGKKLNNKV